MIECDLECFKKFFYLMFEEGVYLVFLVFEVGFVCVEYLEKEINDIIVVVECVFVKF